MKRFAYLLAPLLLAACPDVKVDPGEGSDHGATDGPTVEFDPANSIVPFPNNLLLDPTTGKVKLPMQCKEGPATTAIREGVINKLDGFGTFETGIQVTFTAPVDPTSLTDKVVLLKRADGANAVTPGTPVPTVLIPGKTVRFDATCTTPSQIDALTIIPKVPLDQHSTYVVAVLDGVKTADGTPFIPSLTWALVRQKDDPVTLDANGAITANHTPIDATTMDGAKQLAGIDLLWKAHAKANAFLTAAGHDQETNLLAFEFTTQTVTDVLDPTVAGSPASKIVGGTLPNASQDGGDAQAYLHAVFTQLTGSDQCQQPYQSFPGNGPLPCQGIAQVRGGLLSAANYQTALPNPLAGGNPIPGAFTDPVHPTKVSDVTLQVAIFVPVGTAPTGGWPTLVFGHGVTRSKNDLAAIAGQLAGIGIQSVGIDWVEHGSRAILVDTSAAHGCASSPNPAANPQCFQAPFGLDLAADRDTFRQNVLDVQQLVATLKACGTANCGEVVVDPTKILYAGQSWGGIHGGMIAATTPDIKASVLNVAGVAWLDLLENTKTLAFSCPLVDALIDAGVLTGDKSNLAATPPTGLCTTNAWKSQPGYAQFGSIARWALDPGDGANYTKMLAARKFLLQEVVDDHVVPNISTDEMGGLTGLMPMIADPYIGSGPASAAITTMPTATKWVRYPTLPANAATSFPGNTYAHGSLLAPATADTAGALGTGRMQLDAFTFLSINK